MPSCLSLRQLKKPWWKSLTSKIQSKLHNKPKAIQKLKNRPAGVVVPAASRPHAFSLNPRLCWRRKRRAPLIGFLLLKRHRRHRAPVFIDSLFIKDTPVGPEKPRLLPDRDLTAKEADGAWESVGFASPLMHGIDARAEEFIAKFRADMEVQEMLARGL